jgi:hypothetical protein
MTISTRPGLIAAVNAKANELRWLKQAARVTATGTWASMFETTGTVGKPLAANDPGVLAGSSTLVGVVPTHATDGFPPIRSFNGGAGLITKVVLNAPATGGHRFTLHDMLFKAGAYAFNAADTLGSQPSYAARVPGGIDFTGLQIWFECVTTFTGNPTVAVTYTDDQGNIGHTTGAVALTTVAPVVGRLIQLPLQAGDNGVSKIESVTCTVAAAGTFNILVLRPLVQNMRTEGAKQTVHDANLTGLPLVFDTSALYPTICTDGTTSGSVQELRISIASG